MDLVCSNKVTKKLGSLFGKTCLKTLLSSPLNDPTSYVTSPGVPTKLIYSTKRSGYLGTTGAIISGYLVRFKGFLFKKVRNQNDNTLPLSSTLACSRNQLLKNKDSKCKKIDANYFSDFYHEKNRHHTEFILDKDFMLMGSQGEL
jgi:hypothetical protein